MEPLYENTVVLEKDIFLEASKARFNATRKKYRVFVLICFIVVLLFSLFNILGGAYRGGSIMLVFSLAFLFLYLKGYLIGAPKVFQSMVAVNPFRQIDYAFYYDHFESTTSNSKTNFQYEMITYITETDNTFVLLIVESLIIINKLGFQKGDAESFGTFLENKCPLARIYMN